MNHDTVLLRLAGPMQSWGTDSRLQVRRTSLVPGKSAVVGLILCAMGKRRDEASESAEKFSALSMGVRVDREGHTEWDYHTAGAGYGIRQAQGGIKRTASTKEPETLLSRRQYLMDAAFTVALRGDPDLIEKVDGALRDPKWPVFLGRKCCVPSEPVFAGTSNYPDLVSALRSVPLVEPMSRIDSDSREVAVYLDHTGNQPPPNGSFLVYDVPRSLKNPSHGSRWVVASKVEVSVISGPGFNFYQARRGVNYAGSQWKTIRVQRLLADSHLCVFCKCPAEDVHHVTYERVGQELIEDLRSLCKVCHDACTQLEYGTGMTRKRIDPTDPSQRDAILRQVCKLLSQRQNSRRRAIREMASREFMDNVPNVGTL